MPLVQDSIEHTEDLTRFAIYFQTALKHHPQHLGFLFPEDGSGKTAFCLICLFLA